MYYEKKRPQLKPYKLPESVLVVIHADDGQVLLLERADHPGWWQSVTGSREAGENLQDTARREVSEETGLDVAAYPPVSWGYSNVYEIFPCYRHRYAPGTTHNTEHVFGMRLPQPMAVRLSPGEHLGWRWLPAADAAALCFSPSNAAAIRRLLE